MKRLIIFALMLNVLNLHAQASDDNEIYIQQSGDSLTLTIDQQGYGNKVGGNDFSTTAADMVLSGATMTLNLDQIGNQNLFYGPVASASGTFNLEFTGDSNEWDWSLGQNMSADYANIFVDVTGSSNSWDLDVGAAASAEYLDFDLTLIGDSNIFDIDVESDSAIWNFDITGGSNNILTSQSDGSDHEINATLVGDSADIDIIQSSGTCPTGVSTCSGSINLDVTADNATITINQID